ncbi:hypothetical protein [Neisseria meningitidis]|uniref:hypothetical protein n=1 Tax=Neisseria meningitidis TaxID=487 RepID=UPI000A9C1A80|nr:hypothetical protein [Neisseria meningitidis]
MQTQQKPAKAASQNSQCGTTGSANEAAAPTTQHGKNQRRNTSPHPRYFKNKRIIKQIRKTVITRFENDIVVLTKIRTRRRSGTKTGQGDEAADSMARRGNAVLVFVKPL